MCVHFRYETAGIAADAAGGVGDRNAAAAAVIPAPRPPRRAGWASVTTHHSTKYTAGSTTLQTTHSRLSSISYASIETIRHDERNPWFSHTIGTNQPNVFELPSSFDTEFDSCEKSWNLHLCFKITNLQCQHFVNFYVTLILCALIFVLFCVFSYLWNELVQF